MTPDPTLIEQELLPCPFCALRLREDGQEWHHEMADCPLSDCVFDETQVAEWNTRARQGSAVLPSEVVTPEMIEAGKAVWLRHVEASAEGEDREAVVAIYTAMRAATPTAPVHCTMGVGCDEAGVCYAAANGEPDRCQKLAPVQDDDAELVKRIDQRIAEHRAHLSELQAKYGRGVVPDERSAGLVVNFGDLLDLRSRLSPTPETGLVEALRQIAERLVDQQDEPWPVGTEADRLHYWRDKAINAAREIESLSNVSLSDG